MLKIKEKLVSDFKEIEYPSKDITTMTVQNTKGRNLLISIQLINESDLILGLYEHNSPVVFKPSSSRRKETAMSVLATAHKTLNFLKCHASDTGSLLGID